MFIVLKEEFIPLFLGVNMEQKEKKSEDIILFMGYLFFLFALMIMFRVLGALFNYFF